MKLIIVVKCETVETKTNERKKEKKMNDWRRAIRTPISYSIPGSSSNLVRQQTNFVSFVIISGAFVLLILYAYMPPSNHDTIEALNDEHGHWHEKLIACDCLLSNGHQRHNVDNNNLFIYNRTYPMTAIETMNDGRLRYHIAVVADLDKKSRSLAKSNTYLSYILNGQLVFDPHTHNVEVEFEPNEIELSSQFSSGGRGMELSELVVFNGKLYTCDDRTGIVFEIRDSLMLPWIILPNGNGHSTGKGFKCEWMTVKDDHLYVGSLGKEWTSPNGDKIFNYDPQYVKKISAFGHVEHLDWRLRYIELRRAAGIEAPGYLVHEAAVWSMEKKQWYFLPRRASHQPYDDSLDEQRGTNIFLIADDNFTMVNKNHSIGPLIKTHGFSSMKLLPLPEEIKLSPSGTEIVIAIKSEEDDNTVATYLMVFRLPDGHLLLPEMKISTKHKYEGIEFV